jgi:sulfide dehydrogenase [flavocytochrome c] flavoprotein subunit
MVMMNVDRRSFIKHLTAAAGASVFSVPLVRAANSPKARVLVVGGGFGGASVAKYLRLLDPGIEVTLIERSTRYTSCPLSNEVLSESRDIKSLETGYERLARRGVKLVHAEVTAIDPVAKQVTIADGKTFVYDALIVSPGVDFNYGAIVGLTPEISDTRLPHAWKAGAQTLLLKKQLAAMPDNGRFIISVPKGPLRCPPGPYERAAQVAMYCKHHGKKKAKILILDANDNFSKRALFEQAWKALYGYGPEGMIEWVSGSGGGAVEEVNAETMTCRTNFDEFKADVLNVIPPHHAGVIAKTAGLVNSGLWCAVKPDNMESTAHKDVYVIGDSCAGGDIASNNPFPKSAHMANSQAKVVAASLVAKLNGLPPPVPIYTNTCYSVVDHEWGFSVVHLYRVEGNLWVYVKEGSGISPVTIGTGKDAKPVSRLHRKIEAQYAAGWLNNLMADAFG